MISLGSGTSGGVLAPLLMMGAALGGVESIFLPQFGQGFWPLVSMGAILGGTMRSPFTGIVFALELTHDFNRYMRLAFVAGCQIQALIQFAKGHIENLEFNLDRIDAMSHDPHGRTPVISP